jgi:hypothetical protein
MLSARGSASRAISWMVGVSLKGCHSSIKNEIQVWQQFNRKTQPDWNDCTAVSMIFMTPPNPRSSMHCGSVLSMFMRESMLYSGYFFPLSGEATSGDMVFCYQNCSDLL